MITRTLLLLIAVVSCFICLSCSQEDEKKQEQSDLDELKYEILSLTDASCDTCTQCRSIAFGSKACGGPHSYLIYSMKNTDSTLLASKVAAYNKMERDFNNKWGVVSDCSLPLEPNVFTYNTGTCTGTFVDTTGMAAPSVRLLHSRTKTK
jgi:hypothetical protein